MKYTKPALTREQQAYIISQRSAGNHYRLSGSMHNYGPDRIGSQSMYAKRQMELLGLPSTISLESTGFPNDRRRCSIWCVKPNRGADA
jgi:hypothetical protein